MNPQQKIEETTYANALFECVAEADHLASFTQRVMKAEKPCYKTKKDPSDSASRNSNAKGATLTVRFADHLGIKHPLIEAYKGGSSGIASGNEEQVREIAVAIVNHFAPSATDKASLVALCADALHAYGNPPTTVDVTAETVIAPSTIEFGVAPTTIVEPAQPADPLAGIIPANANIPVPQVATATEDGDKVLLSTWAEFKAILPSIQAQEAQVDALIMDFFYNRYQANGLVPRYSVSGKKEIPKEGAKVNITSQLAWDNADQNAYMHMAGDILEIANHRKSNGKMRQWFFQLVKGDPVQLANRMWLCKALVGAVLSKAQLPFYNQRLAKFVGDELRQEVIKLIGVNTELRDSQVIGGDARSWNWKYDTADWKSKGRTEVADIDASSFSLDNL